MLAEKSAPALVAAEGVAAESDLVQPVPEIKVRLSKGLVDWILNHKKVVFPEDEDPDEYYNRMINDPDRPDVYTQEFLEEERETMRMIDTKRKDDRFEKFQKWVRLQVEEKGYVEVGESYIANWVRARQSVTEEQWACLAMSGLKLVDDDEDLVMPSAGRVTVEPN